MARPTHARASTAAPRLDERIALRPVEAAAALGISERKLREMLPAVPHFREGGVLLFPVDELRAWARERARVGPSIAEAVVTDILDSLKDQ